MCRKNLLVIAAVAALSAGAGAAGLFDPQPGVDLPPLAKSTVVCVGENAPAPEQEAARMLADKVSAAGGPAECLLTAEALNDTPLAAGTHHIIAVGTWLDNVVLRKCWGHWSMTRWQREMLKRDQRTRPRATAAVAGRPASMLTARTDGPDWRWTGDFFAFGFGHFAGSVGCVEPSRNPYSLQLIANGIGKPDDLGKVDQFFVIKVTGTDAAGVARAAKALAETAMLHVLIPNAGAKLPANWSPGELGAGQFPSAPPSWAPTSDVPGNSSLRYVGWLQAHSLLYAGFAEAAGVEPKLVWRLKYQTPGGFKDYMSFLTPRASDNEVLIAEVADDAAAQKAVDGLKSSVGSGWQSFTAASGWQGFRSAEGDTFLHCGHFVLSESLPAGVDEALLKVLRKGE